jgi:hypothetical protein
MFNGLKPITFKLFNYGMASRPKDVYNKMLCFVLEHWFKIENHPERVSFGDFEARSEKEAGA